MKVFLGATLIIVMALPIAAGAQNVPAHNTAMQPVFTKFGDLKWERTNPEQGSNSPEVAIVHQTPKETELFIRSPKNYHVPRHWHSANETITVLRGTFILKHDGSDERMAIEPGSFAWMPAKMIHEAWTKPDEGALYFITTDGPFDVNWVTPKTAKVGR
jgi:quercetin dioxygenase-like cupin family protein